MSNFSRCIIITKEGDYMVAPICIDKLVEMARDGLKLISPFTNYDIVTWYTGYSENKKSHIFKE